MHYNILLLRGQRGLSPSAPLECCQEVSVGSVPSCSLQIRDTVLLEEPCS